MTLPIFVGDHLLPKQRLERMRFLWKAPFDTQISPESNKENALPPLWYAEVRGIQKTAYDTVVQTAIRFLARMMLFKASEVFAPKLVFLASDCRIVELKIDIFVVIRERLPV